jgi:DNA replication protein DnaC
MTTLNPAEIKARLKTLGLFGLLACCDEIADKPWLPEVLAIEERERQKRSLERRLRNSRVAAFKPMADFDWAWPKKIDREAVDELFTLSFVKTGHNAVLVGPNGVGKTMILKTSLIKPSSAATPSAFATASDMLADLAAQESSVALARRLHRWDPRSAGAAFRGRRRARVQALWSGREVRARGPALRARERQNRSTLLNTGRLEIVTVAAE